MSENGTPKKPTPRQRRAIAALLATGDKNDAAEQAGVSRRTLYRWMHQDEFRAELVQAETAALDELSRQLVRLAALAVETLERAMANAETDGQRIRAADIVLSRLLQLRELVSIETRLAALERTMK